MTTTPSRHVLQRYIVGIATPDEQEEVELALLASDEAFRELESAERALLEQLTKLDLPPDLRRALVDTFVETVTQPDARSFNDAFMVELERAARKQTGISGGVLRRFAAVAAVAVVLTAAVYIAWSRTVLTPEPPVELVAAQNRSDELEEPVTVSARRGLHTLVIPVEHLGGTAPYEVRVAEDTGTLVAVLYGLRSHPNDRRLTITVPADWLRPGNYLLDVIPQEGPDLSGEFTIRVVP